MYDVYACYTWHAAATCTCIVSYRSYVIYIVHTYSHRSAIATTLGLHLHACRASTYVHIYIVHSMATTDTTIDTQTHFDHTASIVLYI